MADKSETQGATSNFVVLPCPQSVPNWQPGQSGWDTPGNTAWTHGGTLYVPGSVLALTEEQAAPLLARGIVKSTKQDEVAPPPLEMPNASNPAIVVSDDVAFTAPQANDGEVLPTIEAEAPPANTAAKKK